MEVIGEAPDQETFWDIVLEEAPDSYSGRIANSTSYNGVGDLGVGLYLASKEWEARNFLNNIVSGDIKTDVKSPGDYIEEMKAGYRATGTVGASFRIVDDILDGHGFEKLDSLEERKEIAEDYMHSLKTGEVDTGVEHELAEAACKSASIIHRIIEGTSAEEKFYRRLEEIGEVMVEEDESTIEGYRRAREFDSGEYSNIVVDTLHILPSFDVGEEFYQAAHSLGLAYGTSDDLIDGCSELPQKEVERLHSEAFENLKEERGLMFKAGAYLGQFPEVYAFMHHIGDKQKSYR